MNRNNNIPRLSGIPPIGLGTPFAESMESFLWRIGSQHGVPIRAVKSLILSGTEITRLSSNATGADVPSVVGQRYAERLPAMTRRQDSCRVGLGRLNGRMAYSFALRQHRAWCPECVSQMQDETRYWPLAWGLPDYTFCSRHQLPLRQACTDCHQRFSTVGDWLPLERICPRCKADVCQPRLQREGAGGRGHISRAEQMLCSCLELFCKDASELPILRAGESRPGVPRAIDELLQRFPDLPKEDLYKLAGLTPMYLNRLREQPTALPTMPCLSRLSILIGVPIAGILYEPHWTQTEHRVSIEEMKKVPPAFGAARKDYEAVRAAIRKAIDAKESRPLATIARLFDMQYNELRRAIGAELLAQLKECTSQVRNNNYRRARDKLIVSMVDACHRPADEELPT